MTTEPAYTTTAYWDPDHSQGEWPNITETHPALDVAETSGMRWGCLAGINKVEIHSPDGTLQALWDKTDPTIHKTPMYDDPETGETIYDTTHMSNRWQRLGEESQNLGRAEHQRIDTHLRNTGRLPPNPNR